jgi:hypothetical protein
MNKRIVFLLTITLTYLGAIALEAQQLTTNQRPPAQAPAAYSWNPIIPDGSVIGNHVFDNKTTRYTGQIAVGDDGAVIVGAEFPDRKRVGITGLYNLSTLEVIVETGDSINGSVVETLGSRPSDVQLDVAGDVSFRGAFSGAGCANPSGNCEGLFLREHSGARKLVAVEVNANGTYFLSSAGKITGTPGAWIAPPVTAAKPAASGADGKASWLKKVKPYVNVWFPAKRLPGGVVIQGGAGSANGNEQQQAVLKEQGQSKTAFARDGSFKVEAMPAQPNCATPPTFPLAWSDLGSAAGPIAFVRADSGGFPASRYVPQGRPPAQGPWGRRTYYTSACTGVAVALWDSSGKGTLEIVTPVGRVLFLNEDNGKYRLSGVEDVEPPAPGTPIDSLMHITRKGCEVLLPVAFAKGGKAILRGVPLSMANCPTQ